MTSLSTKLVDIKPLLKHSTERLDKHLVTLEKYSPSEARDETGKWTSTGGSKESRASAHAYAASEVANVKHTAAAHFEAYIAHSKAAQAHLNKVAKEKDPANAKIHLRIADTHLKAASSHEQAGLSSLKPKREWGKILGNTLEGIGNAAATVGGVVGTISTVLALRNALRASKAADARRAAKAAASSAQ